MIHYFEHPIIPEALPTRMNNPFHYQPHPLCLLAARQLQQKIALHKNWRKELEQGKMFGILVVKDKIGKVGYLAAFSGNLAHQNKHDGFVPPVFDFLQPDGYFCQEELAISHINEQIEQLQQQSVYRHLLQQIETYEQAAQFEIQQAKEHLRGAKINRAIIRKNNPDMDLQPLIRESQYQKAELKRLERKWKDKINKLHIQTANITMSINALKEERKQRSAALQSWLFRHFKFINARQEWISLHDLFKQTALRVPPAGAGECAGPKLLQYAFCNDLQPLAMAEFWWGNAPKNEIRKHGHFYPACKGKCEPILTFMLQGAEVESETSFTPLSYDDLKIVYEDDWIVIINKPQGMLSVPGKIKQQSVYDYLRKRYPQATGPLLVHRLDMATSGLLLAAKDKNTHQALQKQFIDRTIAKRYVALLNGNVIADVGEIVLPICPDIFDRPRQMVCSQNGKKAITRFEVLDRSRQTTRIALYPLTGRTHQLRVHMAHTLGMNAPIIGDELYGIKADRLYLHAEWLRFFHPIHQQIITVEAKAEF